METNETHGRQESQAVVRDPATGLQIRIGVMGSAGGDTKQNVLEICRRLGRAIADHGCCLLTGACPGFPHETVLGAKEVGGHVIGVSPAVNLKEHVERFQSPYEEYDVLIFTGLGLMGRELINIRSSDIIIVIGGRSGTLGEFAIAYEEGKLIGVVAKTGGVTSAIPAMEATLTKATGAEVLYDKSPENLVERVLKRYTSGEYVCPCHPACANEKKRTEPSPRIR